MLTPPSRCPGREMSSTRAAGIDGRPARRQVSGLEVRRVTSLKRVRYDSSALRVASSTSAACRALGTETFTTARAASQPPSIA